MAIEKKNPADTAYTGGSKATHVGKHGDHPVGGAVGAALGATAGAAAAGAAQGAAAGSVAGAPGIAAGIAIGGVAGALAGKGIAQQINPTTEDAYWQDNYKTRSYVRTDETYDVYRPAYRHGVESFARYEGRPYDEVEGEISSDWERAKDKSSLSWERAKNAVRDAYERLREQFND